MKNIVNHLDENEKTAQLAEALATAYGANPAAAREIGDAAAIHDIGKCKIPGHILNSPNRLTPAEFEVLKTHTILGAEILADLRGHFGKMAREMCEFHHEKFNGKGYWGRYAGQLPYYVSIAAISDVYVALTSERLYKQAWPHHKAMEYIKNQSGRQFCPMLVDIFVSVMADISKEGNAFGKK